MKLVREHINEKFVEDSDPIKDLGIGVITIKFPIRISHDSDSKRMYIINGLHDVGHLEKFLKEHNIEMYIPTPKDRTIKDAYMTYTGTKKDIAELLRVHYNYKPVDINIRLGESVNEKFTEESDPVRDMGIGVFYKKDFSSKTKFYNFLIKNLKYILRVDEIPSTLIVVNPRYHGMIMKSKYYDKIIDYINSYITINGEKIDGNYLFNVKYFKHKLKDHIYVRTDPSEDPSKFLSEKFTEDSDPIHDLGIGIYAKQDFKSNKEFLDFLLLVIPVILKTDKIPEDFIRGGIVNEKYFITIDNYLEEYISCKNISMKKEICDTYAWNGLISDLFKKRKRNETN